MGLASTLPAGRAGGDARSRLIEIITEKSLITGKSIRLSSGLTSRFYFDMKPTAFDPEGAGLIAKLILDSLENEKVDFVGGLEMGAVPIVACVCQKSFERTPYPGFFVRKTVKSHGTKRVIEGIDPEALKGRRVVILEDVATTGESALKAVWAACEAGAVVRKAITVVDRLEGAKKNLHDQDVELVALLTAEDFKL